MGAVTARAPSADMRERKVGIIGYHGTNKWKSLPVQPTDPEEN